MSDSSSRKRNERPSPEPSDGRPPQSKKAKPLGPSQSFSEVLQDMSANESTLAGPHLQGTLDSNKALVFQLVESYIHQNDPRVILMFGVTETNDRVLVHVTEALTLPRRYLGRLGLVADLLAHYQIPTLSWMELPVGKYQAVAASDTVSYNRIEVMTKHGDIIFHAPQGKWKKLAPLTALSTDIETAVRPDYKFPDFSQTAELPVIQIGNILESLVDGKRQTLRIIFTLKGCTAIEGAQVRSFPDERSLLMAWKKFIIESDPDLITGFNIGLFDFVYLILRAEVLGLPDFACLGRLKGVTAVARKVSSQEARLWRDAPILAGRLQIDVRQYVQEKFRGMPTSLNAVSEHFLDARKEDVDFKTINALQAGSDDDRKKLAVYCLKDCHLPLRLFHHLKCFNEAVAAARTAKYIHLPFGVFLREGRNLFS
ncbi:ribonuclease H-like domain-containing protein [Mycena galericulata]|nr:ribonuclease H-like domain-containing protein [Mycena galericulata]